MIPTGNIYLQVFNKASGKFIELSENTSSISLFVENTGIKSLLRSPNFSGFSFSNPIKASKLEMMPIDIGTRNITGSGDYAINIGIFNSNTFSIPGFVTSGFLGGANLGYYNAGKNSTYTFNLGATNSSTNSHAITNLGFNNSTRSTEFLSNVGFFNNTESGYNLLIFGYDNNLFSGRDVTLLGGYNYTLKNLKSSNILGRYNNIQNGDSVDLIGNSNLISGITNILNLGDANELVNSQNITVINDSNSILNSQDQTIIGNQNSLINTKSNLIFGSLNSLKTNTSSNNIFGSQNLLGSSGSIIYGNSNTNLNDSYSKIYGSNNSLSGTKNVIILGSNNSLSPSILNQLYRVELTGITGFGPTLFTGVTGYRMLGGYRGVIGSGGAYNFIIGNENLTSLNNSSYAFGKSNILLNNEKSLILGNSNYLESTSSSYVFGDNNSVSGYKNYIIGNNNIVRSGDYNSILIGISHEFTGDFKVCSINIASLDSKIEVNPNEVKISSPSRPKYNDVEITMPQDLLEYSKQENAINISGYFQNTIFQDSKYNSLAAQIELQKFSYSGVAQRYYVSGYNVQVVDEFGPVLNTFYVPESTKSFTGINPDSSKYIFTNHNYFNKIYWGAYTGTNSILGNYFYESNDKNLLLSQTYDTFNNKARAGSKWVIRKSNTDGCYYLNYNNTNINDPLPFTGWFATGFSGFSGTNPAPVFKISKGFSGVFDKKILNVGNFDKSEHFTAQVCYPSEDISVIYGTHSTPKFQPTWLIVDNFSSGIYYINKNYNETTTPQTGWSSTGFAGATGYSRNPDGTPAFRLFGRTGINLSMGSRSAILAANVPGVGDRIYIPYFY